ncbi:MAG TPA: sugar phosphate isomerase/epimerase [Chloroflexi bacterium]|nr:sugar phosphate isomerase/epimerase [Chloroflexota bacterium]
MRLGGPVFVDSMTPDRWVAALQANGYGAAYCPVTVKDDASTRSAYVQAARDAGIVIAEVGAWSNPLSPDPEERARALAHCQAQLALADEVGARCCVNIAGSRGQPWDGPHPQNFTSETFDMIVESVRAIIDAVRPTRTYYTLEPMPWMYPDSADSYLALLRAIDRERFAVHVDVVNVVNSPRRYYDNTSLIREWFSKLGPYIRSCHAKDTRLSTKLTTHLDEVRPGLGNLDYRTLLVEIERVDPELTLMIEHLHDPEDYRLSADYIRGVAHEVGVSLRPFES